MARKMMIGTHKVDQRGDSYTTVIRKNGTAKRFTAPTLAELRDAVEAWQDGLTDENKGTLKAAIEEYIQTCKTAGHSESTITGYHQLARNAYKLIGDKQVASLTLSDIQSQVNAYARAHSPKSSRNAFGLLHKVLSIYKPRMNLSSIVLPTNKNKLNEDAGIVIPDDQQIISLLNYCRDKNPQMFKAILIASQCGLRRSQICALTWADISSDALTVSKAAIKGESGITTKAPKSSAGHRTIVLPPVVSAHLEPYRTSAEDHVVHLTPDAITRRWERITGKLGIVGRFHDLRHYHASIMIALGVPQLYAMREMGHSTPTMYKKVYAHMFPNKKEQINAALSTHATTVLNGIVTK